MHDFLHSDAKLLQHAHDLLPDLRRLFGVIALHAGGELARLGVAGILGRNESQRAVGGHDGHFGEEILVGRGTGDGVEVLGEGGHFAALLE
jgi:hypothetical protein